MAFSPCSPATAFTRLRNYGGVHACMRLASVVSILHLLCHLPVADRPPLYVVPFFTDGAAGQTLLPPVVPPSCRRCAMQPSARSTKSARSRESLPTSVDAGCCTGSLLPVWSGVLPPHASVFNLLKAAAPLAAQLAAHNVQGGAPSAARSPREAQGLCAARQGLPQEGGHHQGGLGF